MFVTVICGTPGLFLIDSSLSKDQNRQQAVLLGTTYISALFASFALVFFAFLVISQKDSQYLSFFDSTGVLDFRIFILFNARQLSAAS